MMNSASAAVAALTVVMAAATVATLLAATSAVMLGLKLFGGGIAYELHVSHVAHRLAGELVVEVHGDLVIGDLGDDALDTHAFLGHHRDDGAHADVFMVKLAVDVENLLLELIDQVGVLDAESFLGLEGKVKFLTLLQIDDVILETLDEREVESEDKSVRVFGFELEYTDLLIAVDYKDFVHELDVLTCLNFIH